MISNAADAVEGLDDRKLSVRAWREGGRAVLTVRDRGAGVAPAVAERIFDPFYTTKGVGRGLGLGLSISYNIIKDFGGSLTVSNHPEGGAVFRIELAVAGEAGREGARMSESRILLVDDEEELRRSSAQAWELAGFRVDTFAQRRASLERIAFKLPRRRHPAISACPEWTE